MAPWWDGGDLSIDEASGGMHVGRQCLMPPESLIPAPRSPALTAPDRLVRGGAAQLRSAGPVRHRRFSVEPHRELATVVAAAAPLVALLVLALWAMWRATPW